MGKVANKIFERYQYLADHYANKIWNSENLGLEKEDLSQELKIRLFLSIKTYSKRWKYFKETGKSKPIPLEYYLKTTLLNKSRDLIKEINSVHFVKTSQFNFDIGSDSPELRVEKLDILIGSESLLDIFPSGQRRILKSFILRDFNIEETKKYYKGKLDVDETLDKLRNHLEKNKSEVNEFMVLSAQE